MEEMTAPRSVVDDPRHLRDLPDGWRGLDRPSNPLVHRRNRIDHRSGRDDSATPSGDGDIVEPPVLGSPRQVARCSNGSTGVFLSALSIDGACPPYSNTNPSGVER
jgi:hypothetical protein